MNGKRAKELRKFAYVNFDPIKNFNKKATNQWNNWKRLIKKMYVKGLLYG